MVYGKSYPKHFPNWNLSGQGSGICIPNEQPGNSMLSMLGKSQVEHIHNGPKWWTLRLGSDR